MKQTILIISALTLWSCSKKESNQTNVISSEAQKIDSLNIERQKLNDSIAIRNQQNIFKDLSGKHQLKFSSDETAGFSGATDFEKVGRDEFRRRNNSKN